MNMFFFVVELNYSFFGLNVLTGKSVNKWARKRGTTWKGFNAWHAAGGRRIRFFYWSRMKVQENPRDTFSNVWEYLHCLNCELYFNGFPRQHCTNAASKQSLCYLTVNNKEFRIQTWAAAHCHRWTFGWYIQILAFLVQIVCLY